MSRENAVRTKHPAHWGGPDRVKRGTAIFKLERTAVEQDKAEKRAGGGDGRLPQQHFAHIIKLRYKNIREQQRRQRLNFWGFLSVGFLQILHSQLQGFSARIETKAKKKKIWPTQAHDPPGGRTHVDLEPSEPAFPALINKPELGTIIELQGFYGELPEAFYFIYKAICKREEGRSPWPNDPPRAQAWLRCLPVPKKARYPLLSSRYLPKRDLVYLGSELTSGIVRWKDEGVEEKACTSTRAPCGWSIGAHIGVNNVVQAMCGGNEGAGLSGMRMERKASIVGEEGGVANGVYTKSEGGALKLWNKDVAGAGGEGRT
ncbi:hypothetical protein C8J57DRAFT_1471400 [Mycena rebaudengoi]|nr:hypothetical protein C8J57DRAFT_1471400 [Mycena rebaudengoi]